MRVTFINVGYGDAILFQHENGYTALLDGGSNLPEEFSDFPFRIRAADYLKEQKIRRLDAVFISHIHEDHVCGLEPILEQCTVETLYVPYPAEPFLRGRQLKPMAQSPRSVFLYAKAFNAYCRMLAQARKKNAVIRTLRTGDSLSLAPEFTVRVLAPRPAAVTSYLERIDLLCGSASVSDALLRELDATSNAASLLLKFETGDAALLAASDCCPQEWSEVPLACFKNVNVLKLPHHGQADAVSEPLMREMPLQYVITTASSDRRYHSANSTVYARLSALYPPAARPQFLFSDERRYPPYFHHPEGFQAITLVMDSGTITTEFVETNKTQEKDGRKER